MKLYPSVHLTIVGKSKAVYRPTFSKTSLCEESFKYFENHDLMHRITHYERLDTSQYSKLLSKSQLHFYLSRPFVASWSLLEAMSSGCSIISNITPMTAEFLNHKRNALLVDSVDTNNSVNDIKGFFADKDLIVKMAANAREYALGFSYQKQLKALKSFIGY